MSSLADRMKDYESLPDTRLMRREPIVMRLDGKAFHTYTRGMERPWDMRLVGCMVDAASALCAEIQGCQIAYVQSDEISLLLTDWDKYDTDCWFGYRAQKMVSVAASICAVSFLRAAVLRFGPSFLDRGLPAFDARVWNLPRHEVNNYFVWRQQDATRNSIQMLGQSKFSHKALHGKNTSAIQEMLFQEHGINWDKTPTPQKRGTCIVRLSDGQENLGRSRWKVDDDIPIFTQDVAYIERFLTEPFAGEKQA